MTLLTFFGLTALINSASAEPVTPHQIQVKNADKQVSDDWEPASSPAAFVPLSHFSDLSEQPYQASGIHVISADVSDAVPVDSPLSTLLEQCTNLQPQPRGTLAVHSTSKALHQVWVKGHLVGQVDDLNQAQRLAQRLSPLIEQAEFKPSQIIPDFSQPWPIVRLSQQAQFMIRPDMAQSHGTSPEWAAVQWANRLRVAFGNEPLDVGTVQMALQGLEKTSDQIKGTASWYGPYFHGRLTATGEIFDQNELTVAHKSLPFGTRLKVRNLLNDRTIVVRVNDRGPYIGDRSLDLSRAAAQCLGSEQTGIIPYEAVLLKDAEPTSSAVTISRAP